MAEILTFDNAPQTEVLSSEEQDSLQVGEQMQAEQENLLAGKYKSSEDLEQAYLELQKKLGEVETDSTEDDQVQDEPEMTPVQSLLSSATEEYSEKGELTPETISKLSQMSSEELVQTYLEMYQNTPEAEPVAELSDADVASIKNSVGGEQEYDNIVGWASQNMSQAESDAFDNIINTGNKEAIQLMVDGLKAKYETQNGYEGRMLQGKQSAQSNDVFRSQAELVQAMSDPRYDNDEAYRSDLLAKLDRSDISF